MLNAKHGRGYVMLTYDADPGQKGQIVPQRDPTTGAVELYALTLWREPERRAGFRPHPLIVMRRDYFKSEKAALAAASAEKASNP
jgi:hypothetical protein